MNEGSPTAVTRWLSAAAKAVALFGFTLPWLHVSVAGRPIVSATGLDLTTGTVVARLPIVGTVEGRVESVALPAVAVVLAAAGLAAVLSTNRRHGAGAGLILSALAALIIAGFVAYGIYVHLPLPLEQMNLIERLAHSFARKAVHAGSGSGFWLTMFALLAGMVFDWHILRGTRVPPK